MIQNSLKRSRNCPHDTRTMQKGSKRVPNNPKTVSKRPKHCKNTPKESGEISFNVVKTAHQCHTRYFLHHKIIFFLNIFFLHHKIIFRNATTLSQCTNFIKTIHNCFVFRKTLTLFRTHLFSHAFKYQPHHKTIRKYLHIQNRAQ